MSNNGFLDMLGSMGLGVVNMLPGLITGVPEIIEAQLAAQAKESGMSPIIVGSITPLISQMYGSLLDWVTGSNGRALQASDFLGNPTTRALQQAKIYNATYKRILDSAGVMRMADSDLEAALRAIYGNDRWSAEKDSLSSEVLGGIFKQNREGVAKTARSIVYDMFDRLGINVETGEGISGDPGDRQIAATTWSMQAGEAFNSLLSDALFTPVDGQFRSRSLSQREVGEIAKEFFRDRPEVLNRLTTDDEGRGRLSREDINTFNRHLERIAGGIDNMKDALGRNLSMQQAREIAQGIYGFDIMRDPHSQTFAAVSETMKQVMLATGIKSDQLFGNRETGDPGYLGSAWQMLGNAGLHREVIGNIALATSIYAHGSHSNAFGVSNEDRKQAIQSVMANIELSGDTERLAAMYTAWADKNGKEDNKQSISDFLKTLHDQRIDLNNLNSVSDEQLKALGIDRKTVNSFIGSAELRQRRTSLDPYLNASLYESRQMSGRAEILKNFKKSLEQAGVSEDKINKLQEALFSSNAGSIQTKAAELGLSADQLRALRTAYTNADSYAKSFNIDWVSEKQLQRQTEIYRNYGSMERYAAQDLTTSVLQYFKTHGDKATLADAVSVALFGHTGVIKDDSVAAKFVDGSLFASEKSQEQELTQARAYAYRNWKEKKGNEKLTYKDFLKDVSSNNININDAAELIKKYGSVEGYKQWKQSHNKGDVHRFKLAAANDDLVSAAKGLKKYLTDPDPDPEQYLTAIWADLTNRNADSTGVSDLQLLRNNYDYVSETYGKEKADALIRYAEAKETVNKLEKDDVTSNKTPVEPTNNTERPKNSTDGAPNKTPVELTNNTEGLKNNTDSVKLLTSAINGLKDVILGRSTATAQTMHSLSTTKGQTA